MRRSGGHTGVGNMYISTGHQNHHPQQHNKQEFQQNQFGWERDESHLSSPMSPQLPHQDVGSEATRSYHESQRLDPRNPFEKQGNSDPRQYGGQRSYQRMPQEVHGDPNDRSRHHVDDMDIGYEDSPVRPSFEKLEHKFFDDIMKLSKEQSDAEDAENVRHMEICFSFNEQVGAFFSSKINAINAQYQEHLLVLRSRHTNRRDEYLRKESQARHQLYQQVAVLDDHPSRGTSHSSDPRSYNVVAALNEESHRTYDSGSHDGYRERGRVVSNARDHGLDPRVPYPAGRAYDHGSRYR
ncbi:hypothetical protein Leryth_014774 [Lithospermum erythrorhizon]|nr:hypothetical protein Leryth_014774 [Lithospermum erythrorhizon]